MIFKPAEFSWKIRGVSRHVISWNILLCMDSVSGRQCTARWLLYLNVAVTTTLSPAAGPAHRCLKVVPLESARVLISRNAGGASVCDGMAVYVSWLKFWHQLTCSCYPVSRTLIIKRENHYFSLRNLLGPPDYCFFWPSGSFLVLQGYLVFPLPTVIQRIVRIFGWFRLWFSAAFRYQGNRKSINTWNK